MSRSIVVLRDAAMHRAAVAIWPSTGMVRRTRSLAMSEVSACVANGGNATGSLRIPGSDV